MVWGVSGALNCGFSAVLPEFSPSAAVRRSADLGGVRKGKQLFRAMERSWLCLAQISERAGSAGSAGCRTRQGTEGISASATANAVCASLSEPSQLLEPRTTEGITLLIPAPRGCGELHPKAAPGSTACTGRFGFFHPAPHSAALFKHRQDFSLQWDLSNLSIFETGHAPGWALVGPKQLMEAEGQVAHSMICSEIRAKRAPDNPRTC